MLPAQPPNSRRSVGTRNETFRMCTWSGRICSAKRPGKVGDGVEGERAADQCRHGGSAVRGSRAGARGASGVEQFDACSRPRGAPPTLKPAAAAVRGRLSSRHGGRVGRRADAEARRPQHAARDQPRPGVGERAGPPPASPPRCASRLRSTQLEAGSRSPFGDAVEAAAVDRQGVDARAAARRWQPSSAHSAASTGARLRASWRRSWSR